MQPGPQPLEPCGSWVAALLLRTPQLPAPGWR